MVIIPLSTPGLRFDFIQESKTAAVNEACAGTDAQCSLIELCQECAALAIQIQHRLERAFVAGQASMMIQEAPNE